MPRYSEHKYGKDARESLLEGAGQVYKAVSTTLGARGRNVVLWKNHDTQIQHDGVTVAQEIKPKDPYENAGASILKEAAQRQVTNVGDGTTVAIILGYAIAKEALKIVESGVNPMSLRSGLEKGRDELIEEIKTYSKPVVSKKEKIQIATVSSEDEELGKIVGETLHKTGVDGVVTVNDVLGTETFIEHHEGLQIDSGYMNSYFVTNPRTMTATVKDARILVTDHKLTDIHELIPMLKNVVEEHGHKNLVVIAQDIEGTVMATLVQNKINGQMNSLGVKVPQFQNKDILQDIATVIGAKFISAEAKMDIKKVTLEDLGTATEVKSSNEATVITGGGGDPKAINDRVKALRSQIEEETNDFNREKLQSRLAKLTGGVYVVNVGGNTEVEARERKERAIDAVMATRAAMKEGIVAGGEVIYLSAIKALEKQDDEFDEYAYRILIKALHQPFNKLITNAGFNAGKRLGQVESRAYGHGVNVVTGESEDLIKAGIIDPALVSIEAITNGVSVAIAIITSDAIIVEKDDKDVSKVPNPPGN